MKENNNHLLTENSLSEIPTPAVLSLWQGRPLPLGLQLTIIVIIE